MGTALLGKVTNGTGYALAQIMSKDPEVADAYDAALLFLQGPVWSSFSIAS